MTERDLATGYWSQSDAPKIASFKIDIHDVARIRFQFVANIRIKKIPELQCNVCIQLSFQQYYCS